MTKELLTTFRNLSISVLMMSLATLAQAKETKESCTGYAASVYNNLNSAWSGASNERSSRARDAIWSTRDFSKIYWSLMVRIPGKFDRTKGPYLELVDRFRWAYEHARFEPWSNPSVLGYMHDARRDMAWLSRCYPR